MSTRNEKGQAWLVAGLMMAMLGLGGLAVAQPVAHYHSRHIPAEHINDAVPFGLMVKTNLSYCIEADKLADMKKWGVDTIELRLVWWELEHEKGVFDWSRLDRDVAKVEAGGLKVGLFSWFHIPPDWYQGNVFRCVSHDKPARTLSPWDPAALDVADRIYGATAAHYGKRIDFVYVIGSADYGEPGFPHAIKHYKFSAAHSHQSVDWTGDQFARAAWAKISDVPLETVVAGKADRATALKYCDFYSDRNARYCGEVFAIARKKFPWARFGLPVGHHSEYPSAYNRAEVIKRLCEVSTNITVRWTDLGGFRDFSKSSVFARRVKSACLFYGCEFGEETSHPLIFSNEELSNHASYELVANATSMLHNDYPCIRCAGEKNRARMRDYPCSEPVCDVALLWPDIEEKLYAVAHATATNDRFTEAFVAEAGEFRKRTDYWICDTMMIKDGFLEKMGVRKVVALHPIPPETEAALADFRAKGGVVSDGSDFPPPPDPLVYRTVHRDFISEFTPSTGEVRLTSK